MIAERIETINERMTEAAYKVEGDMIFATGAAAKTLELKKWKIKDSIIAAATCGLYNPATKMLSNKVINGAKKELAEHIADSIIDEVDEELESMET